MADLRLVVGLGNPGARYKCTRHNVGFRLIELLASEDGRWKDFSGWGRTARQGDLILAQPLTYMNESGRCVCALKNFYKIAPEEMLICFDDVALQLGRLRLRASGSSGGQKGMQSIIDGLGTLEIPRLRIGVGPQPPGWDSTDFVLNRFSAQEEKKIHDVLDEAAAAVKTVQTGGLEAAMNRFNSAP